jgi:hypothetical protein
VVSILWIDDLEEGKRFVDEIRKILTTFEPLALEVINELTPVQYLEIFADVLPKYPVSFQTCVTITKLTEDVAQLLEEIGPKAPRGSNSAVIFNAAHGVAAGYTRSSSCFGIKGENLTGYLFSRSMNVEDRDTCEEWFNNSKRRLRKLPTAVEWSYINLDNVDGARIKGSYPEYERLIQLKQKIDPYNVFKNGNPRLLE